MELDVRVVVHIVVEPLRADDEARHHAAAVHLLQPVGDVAGDGEIHDAVGEHFGVDAQIVLVAKAPQRGVGDGADAHLQRRTIFDETGDVGADGILHG